MNDTRYKVQVRGFLWDGSEATWEKTFDELLSADNIGKSFGDFSSIKDYQIIKIETENQFPDALTHKYICTKTIVKKWDNYDSMIVVIQRSLW